MFLYNIRSTITCFSLCHQSTYPYRCRSETHGPVLFIDEILFRILITLILFILNVKPIKLFYGVDN